MNILKSCGLYLLLCLLPACGQQLVEFPNPGAADAATGSGDARDPDARSADSGNTGPGNTDAAKDDRGSDTTLADGGLSDAGRLTDAGLLFDAGTIDAGLMPDGGLPFDAGTIDAALQADAASTDAASTDAASTDAASADVASADAASTDSASTDAASTDSGLADSGLSDTGSSDTGNPDGGACSLLPVSLGAAGNFVVLAGSTVTNTGPSSVTGDLGVSPGTAVTGFPPGSIAGSQHAGTPTAAQGVADLTIAYNDAAGRTLCPVTVAGNLGGQTLAPGLYKSTSSLEITSGDLTLDAQGNGSAVFIFQMASTLTTTAGRQVILSGGAKSSNVFWQVGTSATLGSTSAFQGTVMADQSVTLNTGATLNGRALARIGAVTLDSNTIVKPAP